MFIGNYEIYGNIVDSSETKIPDHIKKFMDNRRLVGEARNMLAQLDPIPAVINGFQDDKNNLSDSVLYRIIVLKKM